MKKSIKPITSVIAGLMLTLLKGAYFVWALMEGSQTQSAASSLGSVSLKRAFRRRERLFSRGITSVTAGALKSRLARFLNFLMLKNYIFFPQSIILFTLTQSLDKLMKELNTWLFHLFLRLSFLLLDWNRDSHQSQTPLMRLCCRKKGWGCRVPRSGNHSKHRNRAADRWSGSGTNYTCYIVPDIQIIH